MKKYDIGFGFMCYHLNNGCFYDTFEYFCLFKSLGYDCCFFMIVTPETEKDMMMSLEDRYDFDDSFKEHIYHFDFFEATNVYNKKIFPLRCKTFFIPGVSALDCMISSNLLMAYKTMYVMYDRPYEYLSDEFHRKKGFYKNINILYDSRIIDKLNGFRNIHYVKKINFSIFKRIEKSDDKTCLSLYCDHKCYNVDFILKIIEEFKDQEFFIYTKSFGKFDIKYYSLIKNKRVTLEQAPISNFMEKFNRFLYLPSVRGFDPSPRLLAECKYYNKDIIIYGEERIKTIKDGGYYRLLDINKLEEVDLNKGDQIIGIYEENIGRT